MRTYKLRHRFCLIPDEYPFAINARGEVYNFITGEDCETGVSADKTFVDLNGRLVDIKELIVKTFIGELDLPIISTRRDGTWISSRDLTYQLTQDDMKKISDSPLEYVIAGCRFREHPKVHGILVSENGVILRLRDLRFFRVWQTDSHYPRLSIHSKSTVIYNKPISHYVYETFIGPISDDKIIDHKDNIPYHNHWSNLQQITQMENIHRSYTSGLNKHRMPFTIDQIEKMCKMMEDGISGRDIALALGVPANKQLFSMLGRLYRGNAYSDIASRYNVKNYKAKYNLASMPKSVIDSIINDVKNGVHRYELIQKYPEYDFQTIEHAYRKYGKLTTYIWKLNPAQIETIKRRIDAGYMKKQIAEEFNVSKGLITLIAQGRYGPQKQHK